MYYVVEDNLWNMYEETSFPFPSEIVRSTAGLSMDFGEKFIHFLYLFIYSFDQWQTYIM